MATRAVFWTPFAGRFSIITQCFVPGFQNLHEFCNMPGGSGIDGRFLFFNGELRMNARLNRTCLNDFNQFCKSFDVRTVIAASDEHGHPEGFEKEIYALAILRAVQHGDFGEDHEAMRMAISATWYQGYRKGFSAESFNEIFQELCIYW